MWHLDIFIKVSGDFDATIVYKEVIPEHKTGFNLLHCNPGQHCPSGLSSPSNVR